MKISQLFIVSIIVFLALDCTKNETGSPYETGTVTDYEGNIYKTVKIGDQWWMAENLASTKLNDGTELSNITDMSEWVESGIPAYCWYDNDETNKEIYGALYNGYAIKNTMLCPAGWHMPDSSELQTLVNTLGGKNIAGAKLKETGTEYWVEPNWGATNQYGFSARPGGNRQYINGLFVSIGYRFHMWGADETLLGCAIYFNGVNVITFPADNNDGFSVRCIKD